MGMPHVTTPSLRQVPSGDQQESGNSFDLVHLCATFSASPVVTSFAQVAPRATLLLPMTSVMLLGRQSCLTFPVLTLNAEHVQ